MTSVMLRRCGAAIVIALVGCPVWACPSAYGHVVSAVTGEYERLSRERDIWPRFEPLSIPLAVFDGAKTYLFRHPAPPGEFVPVDGTPQGAYACDGRYPAVVANSTAEIGGTRTATVLLDDPCPEQTVSELASIALHEAFHVHQLRHHPLWQANEAALFLYPDEEAELLALRWLETKSLRRALAAGDPACAACWVRRALRYRQDRYSRMDAQFATYERKLELFEGLAHYVQHQCLDRGRIELPAEGFAADDVRSRAYATGEAQAQLLDQFAPAWKDGLEADDNQYLDALLAQAVGEGELSSITESESARIRSAALKATEALSRRRAERKDEFEARSGRRVVVTVAGEPLWPHGFDPMNLVRVGGGILHARFLRLENSGGFVEAMGTEALTRGVGPHPLFNGVHEVVVTGLADLVVESDGDSVSVRGDGLRIELKGATIHRAGGALEIKVRSAK